MNVSKTSITLALTAVLGSSGLAVAGDNPFGMQVLDKGYLVAEANAKTPNTNEAATSKSKDGKCGEGKCGAGTAKTAKAKDGKCGEGKCGSSKAKPTVDTAQ